MPPINEQRQASRQRIRVFLVLGLLIFLLAVGVDTLIFWAMATIGLGWHLGVYQALVTVLGTILFCIQAGVVWYLLQEERTDPRR
jgi:hypothetical protein